MLTTPVLKYYHWRPSRKLTTELGIKDHIIDMWHMNLMWMVHAVIINEIWHSGVLLLIFNKKRTFIGQNKSTILTLEPVFRIFRAIRSFFGFQKKPTTNVSCQLDFQRFVSCQLQFWPFASNQLTPSFTVYWNYTNQLVSRWDLLFLSVVLLQTTYPSIWRQYYNRWPANPDVNCNSPRTLLTPPRLYRYLKLLLTVFHLNWH